MSDEVLEHRLEGLIGRIEAGQSALEAAILNQSALLRSFLDRLEGLLERQQPQDENGPTIQELLAEIVLRLGQNATLLRKIDTHISHGSAPPEVVEQPAGTEPKRDAPRRRQGNRS